MTVILSPACYFMISIDCQLHLNTSQYHFMYIIVPLCSVSYVLTTQKKQTMQNTAKQNCPGLVTFYDTWPWNKLGLFYNPMKPTQEAYR